MPVRTPPLTRGQPLDVIQIQNAKGRQRQPERRRLQTLGRIPAAVAHPRQIQDVLGNGGLRHGTPSLRQFTLQSHQPPVIIDPVLL